jgi:hypothetical protein
LVAIFIFGKNAREIHLVKFIKNQTKQQYGKFYENLDILVLGYNLAVLILSVFFLPTAVLWVIKVDPTIDPMLSLKSFPHKNCLQGRLCFSAVLFTGSISSDFG